MGEILGLGISHYPGFIYPDDDMSTRLKKILLSPKVPDELREPTNWPPQMQDEWGDDEGLAFAALHRSQFVDGVRRLREELDAFKPDAVLIFGDDQYENFREDVVPPFCVYIRDEFETTPFVHGRFGPPEPNVWGLPNDAVVRTPGSPEVARFLANRLLQENFPMAYSYTGHHLSGLGHAFINTVLYMDYDQQGWSYPTIPIHVNAYGSAVVRNKGQDAHLFSDIQEMPDPPAPSPAACFDLGRQIGRIIRDSDLRVAIVGSASWSHAFLTEKNSFVYPDLEADRLRFKQMQEGDYEALRNVALEELEACGQHELLNWMPLFGAMAELERVPSWSDLVESYVMNSSKALAVYAPNEG